MAIYLIRHGETLGNAARIVQRPDNPLSPHGVAQAERLARQLEAEGIARIISSDLTRAVMTAELLRRATGAPLEFDPLFQERNFGDLRGTPYAALAVDIFAPDYLPPNGESWSVFHDRVDRAWALVRDAAEANSGHLAVVTHGLVCRSLAARYLTLPAGAEVPDRWENTSVTIAEHRSPWRVRVLNSITHLSDLGASPSGERTAV
jgi:broad specificity phosphatase PhoE